MDRQVELNLMAAAQLRSDLAHRVDGRGRLHPHLADALDLVALAGHAGWIYRLLGGPFQLVQKAHAVAPFSSESPTSGWISYRQWATYHPDEGLSAGAIDHPRGRVGQDRAGAEMPAG